MGKYNQYTDQEIANKAYEWLNESRDNDTDWREFSETATNYYLGKQWASNDKQRMEDTKRAALTVNQIRSLIKLVTGYQRSNRYPIRVYGNDGSDEATANVLEQLIHNIVVGQLYQYQDSQRFLHSLVTGRGYMFGKVDFTDDWLGEIKLHSRINPRHVYYDRMSVDPTLADAEHICWVEMVRENALKALIGDEDIARLKVAQLQHMDWERDFDPEDWPVVGGGKFYSPNPSDRWWGAKRSQKVPEGAYYKVLNCFYRTWDNAYFIADREGGSLNPVDSKKEGEMLVNQFPSRLILVQKQVRRIKSALVCGDQVFDHKDSTTGHRIFPIMPCFGGFYLGTTFGLIEDLKDIQDFVNKRFSNYAHILNTQASAGWIGDEDAIKDWATFEKTANQPGVNIKKKKGSELRRIEPPNIPTAETRGVMDGTELIKVVSGINPDLIGQADKDTSGRAIMLRQQQGYQILGENVDNHRLATVQTAQWMIDAIQNNYTYEKTFRVIMPDQQAQYLTINQKVQDMMTGVEAVLNDVTIGKYDVIVSDQAMSPSMRYLHFQELIEIVRETGVMMPPDVLVRASNLPQDIKEEILTAMQQAVPPPVEEGTAPVGSKGGEVPFPEA